MSQRIQGWLPYGWRSSTCQRLWYQNSLPFEFCGPIECSKPPLAPGFVSPDCPANNFHWILVPNRTWEQPMPVQHFLEEIFLYDWRKFRGQSSQSTYSPWQKSGDLYRNVWIQEFEQKKNRHSCLPSAALTRSKVQFNYLFVLLALFPRNSYW